MEKLIYYADSGDEILDLIHPFLDQESFKLHSFPNGDLLKAAVAQQLPDLVILDVKRPGSDAFALCSLLRKEYPALPIILLSDSSDPMDRVTGFALGCDDFLSKPFLPLELIARIRALMRRCSLVTQPETEPSSSVTFGPLSLFPDRRQAFHGGVPFPLTPSEFEFVHYLILHSNTAVSRDDLIKKLWNMNWSTDTRVADDLVKRLRRKLRQIDSPVKIETVWGYGFRISLDEVYAEIDTSRP